MPKLIKPSDAASWSECARRVWLDNTGQFEQAESEDAFEKLVIELGLGHPGTQYFLERFAGLAHSTF